MAPAVFGARLLRSKQPKSMPGTSQRGWLLRELESAGEEHELVVRVNVVPWIAEAGSGDAHMVAIDDGEVLEVELTGRNRNGRILKGMALRLRCRDGCEVI